MADYDQLSDVELGELPLPQVTLLRTQVRSSRSGAWRVCGVILATALCAAAAVCFMLNKSQSSPEHGTGLRLTLRDQLSHAKITSKAAIHLTGAYNETTKTLEWKKDLDQAFASGGLELVDGDNNNKQVIIPTDGVYFVYSQVSFHISCDYKGVVNLDGVPMTHAVWRHSDSYGGEKPLFSAIRTACSRVSENDSLWYNTIYLGAAFRLDAGDKLRTDTTDQLLSYVDGEHGKTFFGVFAL